MPNRRAQESVFISYASSDKSRINSVIEELKSKGVIAEDDKIVYTTDVFSSESGIREKVRKAIAAASKVVVVWSEEGADSEWVNYETGMAEALEKPIFMVVRKGEISRLPSNLDDVQIFESEYENRAATC
jgi:hypothetical protein